MTTTQHFDLVANAIGFSAFALLFISAVARALLECKFFTKVKNKVDVYWLIGYLFLIGLNIVMISLCVYEAFKNIKAL